MFRHLDFQRSSGEETVNERARGLDKIGHAWRLWKWELASIFLSGPLYERYKAYKEWSKEKSRRSFFSLTVFWSALCAFHDMINKHEECIKAAQLNAFALNVIQAFYFELVHLLVDGIRKGFHGEQRAIPTQIGEDVDARMHAGRDVLLRLGRGKQVRHHGTVP